MSKVENGLFIFRRDLRIVDNNGLQELKNRCKNIYTIFIFTPEQVSSTNSFKSKNAVQFMIESLDELSKEITKKGGKLVFFYGKNNTIVDECIHSWNIDVICFNEDYTPYALERDQSIIELGKKKGIEILKVPDYYLYEPGTIFSGSKKPYQKFTPFYETCLKKKVEAPSKAQSFPFVSSNKSMPNKITLKDAFQKFVGKENQDVLVYGGRENALKQLHTALKTQHHYSVMHNQLDGNTSQLSAYIKFGCLSIREVYQAFKSNKAFVRQLIWRDFYMNILYFFPHVLKGPMKPSYKKVHWHKNNAYLEAWKKGLTGFPVVDAGMRQLNSTGYMHNRARLIVSSFLVKILLIDWREGEKYFAQKLVDYDPASNNGNWQWNAGTGADSQPYFRIFNPWTQAEEYDPEAKYIKEWIPELREVPTKDIFDWEEKCDEFRKKGSKYPCPIVDYGKQREKAIQMYSSVFH
jgi:deoxyribodipyrimidine photo-lyase